MISQNYKWIAQNYFSKFGEIDLIVFDMSKNELVFVEVKTRSQLLFGTPEESINYKKKNRIIKTALKFLQNKNYNRALSWRIDLIAVKLDRQRKLEKIDHLKNIFDG